MLQPVRTKWRKAHKGRIHGNASRANFINYGAYALKALTPERVTGKQIEAARVALTRHMKRQGRVWTRIFPNIPVSKKPIEVRMGKGKGSPEYYACRVKPGRILFEVDGVSEQIAFDSCVLFFKENYNFKDKVYFSHGKIYTLPENINLVACYHPSPRNVNTGRINEKKMKHLFKKALELY